MSLDVAESARAVLDAVRYEVDERAQQEENRRVELSNELSTAIVRNLLEAPDPDVGAKLLELTEDLEIDFNQLAASIDRHQQLIEAELDTYAVVGNAVTWRQRVHPGAARAKLNDIQQIFKLEARVSHSTPEFEINEHLAQEIEKTISTASRLAAARRVLDDDDGPQWFDPAAEQSARLQLARLTRQAAAAETVPDNEEAINAIADSQVANQETLICRTLFVVELEKAAERDDSDSSTWYCDARPLLARLRLAELKHEAPEIFEPVGDEAAV